MNTLLIVASLGLTIGVYSLSRFIYLRGNKHPLLNVLFLSTFLVIVVLRVCHFTYDEYVSCKDIISYFLGPATVALAVPLFKNRLVLKKYSIPILVGILFGSLSGMTTTVLMGNVTGLSRTMTMSLAPKFVTIPIAVEIAKYIGGDQALVAVFVAVTGLISSAFGPTLLTRLKVTDPVARGIALGTTAAGQGVAVGLQEGEMQGAMAGLAMALAGVVTALIAPMLLPLMR
jgi:putative effector of murein hydrolase